MIASFMINPENEVCLAQFDGYIDIAQLRFTDGNVCVIGKADGNEVMFTDEIHEDVLNALKAKAQILVAHLDEECMPFKEYSVPLQLH